MRSTAGHVQHFAATSFSWLLQLSIVGHRIFYMVDVNDIFFASELNDAYFAR